MGRVRRKTVETFVPIAPIHQGSPMGTFSRIFDTFDKRDMTGKVLLIKKLIYLSDLTSDR